MSLPSVTTPPDPWTDERFGSTAPRLVTYTHGEPSRHGGVVVLSAALWGGHHERSVRLDPHEAHALGRELVALAETLERRASVERWERSERRLAAAARTRSHALTPRATPAIRPVARSGSTE